MIFNRKPKHKLPTFPDTVIPTFQGLSEVVSLENIAQIKTAIDEYLAHAQKIDNKDFHVNMTLATELAKCSHYLLDRYAEFSEKHKALVIGAVAYFLHDEDPQSDLAFGTGFDDDVKVMNHVLQQLGIEDRYIDIDSE